jgi:hypothetical protein
LAWIMLPLFGLGSFYVVYYSISSRYMLDFAPAMAAAAASLLLFGAERLPASIRPALIRRILAASFTLWWATELALARNVLPCQPPWGQIHVVDAMSAAKRHVDTLPSHYAVGDKVNPWATNVEYNGLGWDEHTGATEPVIMLFVEDLAELRIECRWACSDALSQDAIDCIRAKVGLEMLRLKSTTTSDGKLELVFARPVRAAYREGIQPVFIAFAPADDILSMRSPWRLLRIDWRDSK